MADEKLDPIAEMLSVDDEDARSRQLPDAELNTDAPEDKKQQERDDAGKFKGKDGEKPPEGEKKPDDKKGDDGKDKKPPEGEKPKDMVPLATFLEKQNKLKEQLDARDITIKQYEQRLATLEAKLTPAPEKPKEPDFVEDPKGYVDHKLGETLSKIEEANKKAETEGKKAQDTAAATQEQVQMQQFFSGLQQHEARFIQTNPDYHDALNHIRGVRASQLRRFDPAITDEQIKHTIINEERNLAVQLARAGRDPVEVAYNLAQDYGYKPKAKDAPKVDAGGKLPEPDAPKRLPPDQTLGSGSSPVGEEVYKAGEVDPVDVALASLFKKRA